MSILSYVKHHSALAITVIVVAVAGAVITGRMTKDSPTAAKGDLNARHVSLVNIDTYNGDSSRVLADGIVESVSQVDLRGQIPGTISSLNVSLGDYVVAGQLIAELSNADIRAQLDQARASLSLEDVSLESARRTAIDAMSDAYLSADEVVFSQIDPMLMNNTGTAPQLSSYITDRKLYYEIRDIRTDLTTIMLKWQDAVGKLSSDTSDIVLKNTLVETQKNIETIKSLLDKISSGLNFSVIVALPSDMATLSAWRSIITAARASMSNTDGEITTAVRSLESALITSGTAKGSSSIANAGIRNLEAQLEKTIIRAPISGYIAALPLRVGELASAGQLLATVVGSGDLQIVAYASGDDISRIARGAQVNIQGTTTTGVVTSVAPSVNPTNKKVEVKIAVNQSNSSGLVVGQNILVSIKSAATSQDTAVKTSYRLPIQNVKIIPGGAYLFTVDSESKIVRHPVTISAVQGNYVEITGDITPGMMIATPVYEIEEGDIVTVE